MSEILKIEHLSCGYGDCPVLNDVNFSVFLSQGRVKAETSDSRRFLDPGWLAKNYFD